MRKSFLPLLLFSCLSALGQLPNTISPADKVYGLARFWQEANYNFIYLDKIDRQAWDQRFRELIPIVQQTPNDYAYYRELQKFCALLKDGHTNVYFPRGIEQMNTMFGDYRLFLENIDGKAIVVRTNLSKKNEIPVGSEIVEVNDKPTATYIAEEVAPYISSSTDYVLMDWSINGLLRGMEGESYRIKLRKPDGKMLSLELKHARTAEQEVYPAFEPDRQLLDFKWLDKKVAYVALNSFGDEKIDSLFEARLPELYEAKGLIIDLRYNGGGSTGVGTGILQYLTNDTVLYGSRYTSRLHIPSFKAWGKYTAVKDTVNNEWAKKSYLSFIDQYYYHFDYETTSIGTKARRIVVPTVLLIGHNTASAAEDFLIAADNQRHMIRIGSNSFGSTGQPFVFELPGGGTARICTKKDTYPDGREFVGYGVRPDIEVKPALSDYLQHKDPVLDKAREYLKNKLK